MPGGDGMLGDVKDRPSYRPWPITRHTTRCTIAAGRWRDEDDVRGESRGSVRVRYTRCALAPNKQGRVAIGGRDGHGAPPHGAMCTDSRWLSV
jgi:hypothetical protein